MKSNCRPAKVIKWPSSLRVNCFLLGAARCSPASGGNPQSCQGRIIFYLGIYLFVFSSTGNNFDLAAIAASAHIDAQRHLLFQFRHMRNDADHAPAGLQVDQRANGEIE